MEKKKKGHSRRYSLQSGVVELLITLIYFSSACRREASLEHLNAPPEITTIQPDQTIGVQPPNISFEGANDVEVIVGGAINIAPKSLQENGSTISSCSISPSLPAWAIFNSTTCSITGTPTTKLASTSYTITATNFAGSTTTSFTLAVKAALAVTSITKDVTVENHAYFGGTVHFFVTPSIPVNGVTLDDFRVVNPESIEVPGTI